MAAAAPPSRGEERVSKQAAKQYEEMMAFMEEMIITSASSADNIELSLEERDLLSAVDARRASLRIISSLEQKEINEPGGHLRVSMIQDYRARVEAELSSACERVLKLLDSRLIPSATSAESKVLYYKMKGDHHRYLAELKASGAGREAEAPYECAHDISREELAATHPIQLGLALNFSVFHHDICNKTDDAWSLANQAVEEADTELQDNWEEEKEVAKLDTGEEEEEVVELDTGEEEALYKNTTNWMFQLFLKILTLCTSHLREDRAGNLQTFSVFHRDIHNKINDAWSLANQAVEEADAELDKREEEEEEEKAVAELDTGMEEGLYRNTTVWILQLLRNNLTLWTSHVTEDREKKQFLHFHNEDDEIPKRKTKMGRGILEAPEAFKSEESTLANEFFKVKTFQLDGAAGDGIGGSSTNDAPK